MKVDASFYLEAASGHFLFGEDDSSAATANRRSAYGGMTDFGHVGQEGWRRFVIGTFGELSVYTLKKIGGIRFIFKVSSWIFTLSSIIS